MKIFLRIVAFIALAYILDRATWYLIAAYFKPNVGPSDPEFFGAYLQAKLSLVDFLLNYGAYVTALVIFICGLIAFGFNKVGLIVGGIFAGIRFAIVSFGVMALREDSEFMAGVKSESDPSGETVAEASKTPATTSQQRAVQRFPELGRANSPLNQEFVRRYRTYQTTNKAYFTDPEWPTKLAEESMKALKK